MKTDKFVSCIKLYQFFHYPQVCSARQKHHADRYILCRNACVSYCHKIIILSTLFLCCMMFLYLVKSLCLSPSPHLFPSPLCVTVVPFYSYFPFIFQPPLPVPFHLLSFPHLLSVLMFLYLNTCFCLQCAHAKLHFLLHWPEP